MGEGREHDEFVILDGRLIDIQGRLTNHFKLLRKVLHTMSELTDAVTAVETGQAALVADVQQVVALLQQPNPDVAEAITRLQAVAASQTQADTDLDAATGQPNP